MAELIPWSELEEQYAEHFSIVKKVAHSPTVSLCRLYPQ